MHFLMASYYLISFINFYYFLGNPLSLKRYAKQRVKKFGKETLVLKEKALIKSLGLLTCVPKVVHTLADQLYAGLLLNACLACPLASILHTPLDELSAKFIAASVVVALEELHMVVI